MLTYLLDPNPNAMSQTMRDSEEKLAIDLTPLETKTIELEVATSGNRSGYGGKSGQSELEKLNDRMTFVMQQMKIVYPDVKLETAQDLVNLLAEDEDFVKFGFRVIIQIGGMPYSVLSVPF